MTNLKNLRERYLAAKNSNNECYRFVKLEQGKDRSLYIYTMSGLKSSYHSNFGKMKPPYRFHYKCENRKVIIESIDENRKKFISEYEGPFAQFNLSLFEKDKITQPTEEDIVYDIKNNDFSDYEVVFFSEKKADLLNDECDNMIAKKIEFESYNIIVGLYQRNKRLGVRSCLVP